MAFISPNKWMRAGYGLKLRGFLRRNARPTTIVDFGHSPVFPAADTFPCVPVLTRRRQPLAAAETAPDGQTFAACPLPRDDYDSEMSVGRYVAEHAMHIPVALLRDDAWTLDNPRIQELLAHIRSVGVPLKDFCKSSPLCGIKTGMNEAYVIDETARASLVHDDPGCEPIIRPLLRGRDMDRWVSRPSGFYLITIGSSANVDWPWTGKDDAEAVFQQTFPSVAQHLAGFKEALQARQDQGRYWWELRSCDYLPAFDQPKLVWQEMAWFNRFSIDRGGSLVLNTAYIAATTDMFVMAVLNSSLAWWYMWRTAQHGKDEVLRLIREYAKSFPIPAIDQPTRNKVDALARELILAYSEIAVPQVQHLELEQKLSALVENAFNLTDEQKDLIRTTAPPRDPINVLASKLV